MVFELGFKLHLSNWIHLGRSLFDLLYYWAGFYVMLAGYFVIMFVVYKLVQWINNTFNKNQGR